MSRYNTNEGKYSEEECCGTCRHHRYVEWDGCEDGWMCANPNGEHESEYTPYKYCCDEYEERRQRMKTVYAHDVIVSVQSHMNMDADGKW